MDNIIVNSNITPKFLLFCLIHTFDLKKEREWVHVTFVIVWYFQLSSFNIYWDLKQTLLFYLNASTTKPHITLSSYILFDGTESSSTKKTTKFNLKNIIFTTFLNFNLKSHFNIHHKIPRYHSFSLFFLFTFFVYKFTFPSLFIYFIILLLLLLFLQCLVFDINLSRSHGAWSEPKRQILFRINTVFRIVSDYFTTLTLKGCLWFCFCFSLWFYFLPPLRFWSESLVFSHTLLTLSHDFIIETT